MFQQDSDYEQFKTGDQKLVQKIIDKKTIIYDGFKTPIGLKDCDCTTNDLKIRDTFYCDACFRIHKLQCSSQDPRVLIWNDYKPSEQSFSFCAVCEKALNN